MAQGASRRFILVRPAWPGVKLCATYRRRYEEKEEEEKKEKTSVLADLDELSL